MSDKIPKIKYCPECVGEEPTVVQDSPKLPDSPKKILRCSACGYLHSTFFTEASGPITGRIDF